MDATQLSIYSETMGDNTYLKLEDARNDRLLNKWLTINDVEQKTMKQTDFKTGEEKEVDKLVLAFEEIKYVLPLNKTNGRVMINDYGPQTDKWLDIKIKLKVNHYPKFEGIGIKSLQDLEDEGETPPAKAVTDDKEQIKKAMKESNAVRNAVDQLNDMNLDVTLVAIRKEVETMMAQNEITKKQHIQALEALGE
jgi:hypothetical protein